MFELFKALFVLLECSYIIVCGKGHLSRFDLGGSGLHALMRIIASSPVIFPSLINFAINCSALVIIINLKLCLDEKTQPLL